MRPSSFTRTPYNATTLTTHAQSSHLGPILHGYDNATDVIVDGGYIRVVQDIRGKYGSEGDYIMNRPIHGPQNPTPVDESTDTYDTIDWLVKNIPESNGKVGILGISYDGFLPLMALIHPHPALKVAVPMNPMVDGWMGDDWFHNGAFRQQNMPYIYEQSAPAPTTITGGPATSTTTTSTCSAGSAGELGQQRGLEQTRLLEQDRSRIPPTTPSGATRPSTRSSPNEPLTVPIMLVHSPLGPGGHLRSHRGLQGRQAQGHRNDKVFLVMGPWHHGQEIEEVSTLGRHQLRLRHRTLLPPEHPRAPSSITTSRTTPPPQLAPVTAFETGTNKWQNLQSWPAGCKPRLCYLQPTPLYLEPTASPHLHQISSTRQCLTTVRLRPRQTRTLPRSSHSAHRLRPRLTWSVWLVDDQREASGRPTSLASPPTSLTAPLKISGQPIANLVASTTGTDSDWVVKLIDVYPDEVADQPHLGGYQLMVSADIFRGRYRESFSDAKPIAPTCRSPIASICLPRTTSSCPATASWCRCSPAGSPSTTATRRPSSPTSSAPNRPTTRRLHSASTTPPAKPAPSNSPS